MNDNTNIPQNQLTVGCTKSVPCFEIPPMLVTSNCSTMFGKTLNTAVVANNRKVDKPSEKVSKVKALIIHIIIIG